MESLKKSWGPDCRVCSARPAARPCPRQPLCPCCPDLPGTPRMLLHSCHLLQGWSCSSVTVSHTDEPSCTLPPPRPTQPTATHLQPFPPAPGCSVLPNVGKGPPSALHTQHRAADALCLSWSGQRRFTDVLRNKGLGGKQRICGFPAQRNICRSPGPHSSLP